MNPIAMLSARDVMTAGRPGGARGQLPLSASVTPDTPLSEVMDALARREGTIGVIDNGAVAGLHHCRGLFGPGPDPHSSLNTDTVSEHQDSS